MGNYNNRLGSRLALTIVLLVFISNPVAAALDDRSQPVEFEADALDLNAPDGGIALAGNVVIRQGTLEINAASADLYSDNGTVQRVELNGNPARLIQMIDNQGQLDASANSIEYDSIEAVVTLKGNVQVKHPQGEISGQSMRYDLKTESFQGVGQTEGDRIRMILEPARSNGEPTTPDPEA